MNFKQNDNKLTANIILNYDGEICNYEFTGIINKNIINWTYIYTENSDVKSGTIKMKTFYMESPPICLMI